MANPKSKRNRLGENVAATLETLWPREGVFKPGPNAERALNLIKRVLQEGGEANG